MPKKILLIGGGFNGCLSEILKHPVEEIYYLELDPKLIKIAKKYISEEFKQALSDPKVKIIYADGRYFLNQTKEEFDLIIINLPDPSTALINRFYTREFFEKAKEKLNQNGILSTYLTFTPTSPGKSLENLNASLYKTLKRVFPQVIILPEETNLFLASSKENLTYDSEVLIQRFKQREIETKFLTESYITYRLSGDRVANTLILFEKNKQAKENKDFLPISYFYQTLFWLEHFYINFSNLFKNIALSFWKIFAGILIILTLFLIKKRQTAKISPILSVAAAGFSLMALEMLIIFSYQIVIGYLYFRIALLISALTAGMAIGVWYGNKTRIKLINFHLLLVLFSIILFFVIFYFANEITILLSAAIAGFLGATIFPIANKIYLSQQPEPNKKTGIIYAADLVGACLGAILPSLILIPVFGLFYSILLITILNVWILTILTLEPSLT